jgi:hypothetical protein
MAKETFQNQLNNRLLSLGSDPASTDSGISEENLGWTWECDSEGFYRACSPEVETVLGIPGALFLGQKLDEYRLAPGSAASVAGAKHSRSFPASLIVQFLDVEQNPVLVVFTIMSAEHNNKNAPELRGFAQVASVIPQPIVPVTGTMLETKETVTSPPTGLFTYQVAQETTLAHYQHASQVITNLLESLRKSQALVRWELHSRVVVSATIDTIEDRNQPPVDKEVLLGRIIYHYPEITILDVEHRLEWGKQLEPDEKTKTFLEHHRYAPSGLAGRLRQAWTPDQILLYDKYSISVKLGAEVGRTERIVLHYGFHEDRILDVSVSDLLYDPDCLLPALEDAISQPLQTTQYAQRGKDYWISRN